MKQPRHKTPVAFLVALSLAGAAPVFAQPSDDQSYRAGIGLLNKGLSDLAAAEFRAYLDAHPDGEQATNARYSLAVCLTRLGKHAEALTHLEQVASVKDFEFAADAMLLQAQCHLAASDDSAAAGVLEDLAERHADFKQLDRATALLGETQYRLGKFKDAATTLSAIEKQWPKSPTIERAELFAAMSEAAAADPRAAADRAARLRTNFPKGEYAANAALIEARSRQQLGDLPAALKFFEVASTAKDQVRAEALLGLASVARAQGDLTRAEKALAEAAKAGLPDSLRDWMTLEQGKLFFQQDKPTDAARAFSTARKSSSLNVQADAAYWSAKCQIKQGKHAEAAANLESAAERFADSALVPDMLFERAAALAQAGDDAAALEAWEQWRDRFDAHELQPDALMAQAWSAHRLGQFDASAALLSALTANHPARKNSETVELLAAENAFAQQQFAPALAAYSAFTEHHPKSPHAWRGAVRKALCLIELDKTDEAAAALTQALASKATQEPALARAATTALADQYFTAANWPAAETWFAKLTAQPLEGDDRLDALLRHAISIERQGRFADALPLFDKVIEQAPDSTQALQARFERGQSLLELGKLPDAQAAFEQVAAQKSNNSLATHALRHLATIASRQGRHENAAAILSALTQTGDTQTAGASKFELGSAYLAAGKYEEAEAALSAFLNSNEDSKHAAKATALRAIALNRLGQHEEAAQHLKESAVSKDLDAETRASVGYELALALRSLNNETEAAEAFRAVAKDAPARLASYARLDLAQIETKAKNYDPALKLLDQCLAAADTLDKADGALIRERATYLRAACLLQMGRPKEAAETLKSFAQTYPDSQLLAPAHFVRGEALLASSNPREAAEELTRAAAINTAAETRIAALLRLGDAWAASQDWAKSEQAFTTFLDRAPESPLWFQARFGQGWARENQGRHDSAIEAYRDVVARHDGPTAARAQFQIGECLYAQKKHDAAVAEFLKTDVLYAYPEWSAAAIYEAGRCLDELNRPDDAAKQFEDLIKRFPDTRWAKLAADKREAAAPAPIPGRPAPAAAPTQRR